MPFPLSPLAGEVGVAEVEDRFVAALPFALSPSNLTTMAPEHPLTVVIVGAGLSGITIGIELQRRGINSFTLYEKNDEDIGGTWRDNTYPNCACDVPSHCELYPSSLCLAFDRSALTICSSSYASFAPLELRVLAQY